MNRLNIRPWSLFCILFLCLGLNLVSAGSRTLNSNYGAVKAELLENDFSGKVGFITFNIYDAYEGSVVHSEIDEMMFEMGNKLHIKSTEKTISRRLLFSKGDIVDKQILLESERLLRREPFLGDAIIEVLPIFGDSFHIIVNTFDQFSTALQIGFAKPANEFEYLIGPFENNFLGTGQTIGAFYSHNQDRNSFFGVYENRTFIYKNLQLSARVGRSTDGNDFSLTLNRPLNSKRQKWGFSLSGSGFKKSSFYYLDADRPGELSLRSDSADLLATLPLFTYKHVVEQNFLLQVTRSFGNKHKFNISPTFMWNDKYQKGDNSEFIQKTSFYEASDLYGLSREDLKLDFRNDFLLGVKFTYYQKKYKTVKNYRNLKWNEDIDVGFSIKSSFYQNMKFLGANNADFYLKHSLVYINTWRSKHFLTTSLSTNYFLGLEGNFEDGTLSQHIEYQWKPIPTTSTFLSSSWSNYFAREKNKQFLLGADEGLNAYPSRFFSGQARLLMNLEQRYFPSIEILSFVPAFAVFLNVGDAFDTYADFDINKLHYSAGISLRAGNTRTVQKIVQHFNISFPIDSRYRKVLPVLNFSLTAKGSL